MCGRFTLTPDAERLFEEFGIGVPEDYRPRWNVAPGQPILAIAGDGERLRSGWLLWGLVPWWRRDKPGKPFVNLRADRLDRTVPRLLERHRCLIPADGFYEWLRRDSGKQPMHLHRRDGGLFSMAALWDRAEGRDGEEIRTVAILTTGAAGVAKEVHDRMPLIIEAQDRATWLDRASPQDTVRALLTPSAPPDLDVVPVSTRVNSVTNDDPACVEPV